MSAIAAFYVSRSRPALIGFICASLLLSPVSANAILFYSTGDPNYNTTAPGGSLANSGWQYEGFWGGFLGTPIAPKYFITAEHVHGNLGDPFIFRGVPYTATAVYDDTNSDLRIWRVCGTFPDFAPIYTNNNETNQNFVVFGRGTLRGAPVTSLLGTKTNGWLWGPGDGSTRWGENVVAGTANGGGGIGDLLQATFDAGGGINECHLSSGDSAGGLFIKEGSVWKLAGINYAVDGPYNSTNSGAGFDAAIFDGTGLYENVAGVWVPASGPGSFYATRVSAHLSWINGVINANIPPEPPVLQSAADADGPFADQTAMVDDTTKTITLSLPAQPQFFRLRACDPLTINSIKVQGGSLVLTYQ